MDFKSCLSEELWAKVSKSFARNGLKMRHIFHILLKFPSTFYHNLIMTGNALLRVQIMTDRKSEK
jgi:hypothetical protein